LFLIDYAQLEFTKLVLNRIDNEKKEIQRQLKKERKEDIDLELAEKVLKNYKYTRVVAWLGLIISITGLAWKIFGS